MEKEEQEKVQPPSFAEAVRRGSRMESFSSSNCWEDMGFKVKGKESFEFPRLGGSPRGGGGEEARARGEVSFTKNSPKKVVSSPGRASFHQ